jgi:hypothetical protein
MKTPWLDKKDAIFDGLVKSHNTNGSGKSPSARRVNIEE